MAQIAWLLLKKILSLALTIFIIASLIFWMFHVKGGDPIHLFVPKGISPELRQGIIEEFYLDKPLLVQYVHYIIDAFTFDLRISLGVYKFQDINDHIWRHIAFTVLLFIPVFLISLFIGWAVDKYAYSRKKSRIAFSVHWLSLFLASVPILGIHFLVVYLVARHTRIQVWGNGTEFQDLSLGLLPDILGHLMLPVLVGALSAVGFLILLQRAGRMEVGHDRSWGIQRPGRWKPGLAMLEYLSVLRPYLRFYVAWTMACVLVVDVVFSYRGLGSAIWQGIRSVDYPFMMATLYTTSLLTLAMIVCTTIAVVLLRQRPISELFADWISHNRDMPSAVPTSATAGHEMPLRNLAIELLRGLKASKIGMAAVAVLVTIAVLGALAPVLATVDDPLADENREGNFFEDDWLNPLPPSLKRSPYTGLLHPLGTDDLGRDVYSLWLYAARGDVAVVVVSTVITVIVSWLVGAIAVRTIGVGGDDAARLIDFLLTTVARAAIAIPLIAFGACLIVLMEPGKALLSIYISLAVLTWAQVFVIRRVRARAKSIAESTGKMKTSVRALMPCILNTSFFVGKFMLLASMAAMSGIWLMNMGHWYWISWDEMLMVAYSGFAYLRGDWHLLLAPIVGLVLLASSAFLILDRLEVVAKHIDRPSCIELEPTEDISVQASSGRQMKSGEPM